MYRIKIKFKDVLAIGFVLPFIYLSLTGELDVVREWTSLLVVILGGYFAEGAVERYREPDKIRESGNYEERI